MKFSVAPDPFQKLSLLGDAARFEPAGADPVSEDGEAPGVRAAKPLPCISHVSTPSGKKPILKAMMTTACERNCYYCPFRAGRSQTQRITFSAGRNGRRLPQDPTRRPGRWPLSLLRHHQRRRHHAGQADRRRRNRAPQIQLSRLRPSQDHARRRIRPDPPRHATGGPRVDQPGRRHAPAPCGARPQKGLLAGTDHAHAVDRRDPPPNTACAPAP